MINVENHRGIKDGNMRNPHARREDPLDQRIKNLIREQAFSTEGGREMFARSRQLLVDYFKSSLSALADPVAIHDITQVLLHELAKATNSRIVDGEENLKDVRKESPFFVISNHYSGYKLMDIEQTELGLDLEEIDDVVPFPFFYAPIAPVADRLGDLLYDAHLELPGSLGKIQEEAGLLVVPKDDGSFGAIRSRTQKIFSRRSNSMVVIFSEGETSGKRNKGGPYDLVEFHGGSFAIAEELGIQVLPVCQYFNPKSGFEVGILPPLNFVNPPEAKVENKDARIEYFDNIAQQTREKMQSWLNTRKAGITV